MLEAKYFEHNIFHNCKVKFLMGIEIKMEVLVEMEAIKDHTKLKSGTQHHGVNTKENISM